MNYFIQAPFPFDAVTSVALSTDCKKEKGLDEVT